MESLANIYENADTFLDHVINETGDNKEKAENLALKLLSLGGYKDYQDYFNRFLIFSSFTLLTLITIAVIYICYISWKDKRRLNK